MWLRTSWLVHKEIRCSSWQNWQILQSIFRWLWCFGIEIWLGKFIIWCHNCAFSLYVTSILVVNFLLLNIDTREAWFVSIWFCHKHSSFTYGVMDFSSITLGIPVFFSLLFNLFNTRDYIFSRLFLIFNYMGNCWVIGGMNRVDENREGLARWLQQQLKGPSLSLYMEIFQTC